MPRDSVPSSLRNTAAHHHLPHPRALFAVSPAAAPSARRIAREAYAIKRQQARSRSTMNSAARQLLESCASEKLSSLDLSGQDLDADAARELATMLPKWYASDRLP